MIREREYQHHPVRELVVSLPGKELKLYVTADFESLITDIEDADQVPCWAEVWPAAYGLARHIWEQVSFAPGEKVLELGAGMGLPGIVCALKGAALTLSDFNPLALQMAGNNARANGVKAALLLADWRRFRCKERYATILASDILYDPGLNPFIGEIFNRNLLPGGRIFVSHPRRPATQQFIRGWHDPARFSEGLYSVEVELEGALLPCYHIAVHLFTNREKTCRGEA